MTSRRCARAFLALSVGLLSSALLPTPFAAAQEAPPAPPAAPPSTNRTTRPSTRVSASRPVTTAPAIASLPPIPRPGVEKHEKKPELAYPTPDSIDELRSLERNVEEVAKKVIPATVCLQIGASSGSGVIVSPDGWILTAGHVSDDAELPVTIVLHDGRRVKGVTYGANKGVDSGLVRIVDPRFPGPWPYAPMGQSNDLGLGQWLVAIGHPGGYKAGRAPVVRLGRLLEIARDGNTLTTDNTLVGGDSGGPLYDLDGRVVGIHSRISTSVANNMHVPVDAFVKDWERISVGEVWGQLGGMPRPPQARVPYMGFESNNDDAGLKVGKVTAGSPAERAGLKSGDIVLKADGKAVKNQLDLTTVLMNKQANQLLSLEVKREGSATPVVIPLRLGEPATQPTRPPLGGRPPARPGTGPSTRP
jgi:serine protease Do